MSASGAGRRDVPSLEGVGQARLLQLARALGQALTGDDVAAAVFEHALVHLGAYTVGLWRVGEGGRIRFAGGTGTDGPGAAREVGAIESDSNLPAALALRSGELVSFGSAAERNRRWPSLERIGTSAEAVVVVPLTARGVRFGVLHIGWAEEEEDFKPDQDLMWALGELCGTALDRAQLYERERNARQILEFLNQGTQLMISAQDPDEIVRSLVQLAVPRLAPWCAVYVAEDGRLVRVAIEISADPALAGELRDAPAVAVDADVPLAQAYRTGTTLVMARLPSEAVLASYSGRQAERILSLATAGWSALVVPIRAEGEVIGVMSLLSPDWADGLPAEISYAAEGLAARAGVALRSAMRYRRQLDNVRLLTAALLPDGVPEIAGLTMAARYVPASGDVCGDWYEVETLPDGRVLVGIGDASGHGVEAAATMARVRHAARGLAVAGLEPAAIMVNLSRLLAGDVGDSIATAAYGIIDPDTGASVWSSAGHPPPVVVSADGSIALMDLSPGPPLGAAGAHQQATLALPPGSMLVLFTDGLFERRGEDLDVGIDRLVGVIRDQRDKGVDAVADAVVAGGGTADDACVLVIAR